MGLQTSHLEAFSEVAKLRSFSKAAKVLHVTQSALSQRIMNLESEIGHALFIRDPAGIRLTDEGQELLRYCRSKDALEEEFLGKLKGDGVSGRIRIGGFSSVMRSLILPVISDLTNKHRALRVELITRELRELELLLASNQVDFILTSNDSSRHEIESHLLGYENNVLVRPKDGKYREGVFLDHDADDLTSFEFLKLQDKTSAKIERCYLDEVYGIMDGVALGMGEAILPEHLVRHDKRLRIVSGKKPLKIPVYLQYYKQPFYAKLTTLVLEKLLHEVSEKLSR